MGANVTLFFGVGAGRCGSMLLANLLNAEKHTLALHEGKERELEASGRQWLPYLTLENYAAYAHPDQAEAIFSDRRSVISEITGSRKFRVFGDIAYNNSPFTAVIPAVFPDAKLIVLIRDGRDFVRSAFTSERPDPTPVGWLDADARLTDVEKFIELGRLRPLKSNVLYEFWPQLNPVGKNAWLWSETYRMIFDAVESQWAAENVLVVRAEDLFSESTATYRSVREFLRIDWKMDSSLRKLLATKVNARSSSSSYILAHHTAWSTETTAQFWGQAGETMARLGYD